MIRPSSAIRPSRIPVLSAASNATSCTPRSQPAPASWPRTPPSAGAEPSARYTRTARSDTQARRTSRSQRAAAQRTSASTRRLDSPRSSWWIQAPFVVSQPRPHHSQRTPDASQTPACHPGVAVTDPSKSSPVMTVPAGASKRIDAVVPRAARPGPPTLRAISPSPTCGRAGSITPPGQFQYAVAPGVGRHAVQEAFSIPKQALTE